LGFDAAANDGRQIRGYQLLEKIGEGRTSVVFRARQLGLDRDVALKVLSTQFAADREAVQRFRRQARILGRLDHSALVRVLDVGESSGRHYIVMALIDGPAVRERLAANHVFDERAALQIATQIARGLAHMHDRGYVHRDVKPAKILLHPDGHAVLTGVGLARDVHDERMARAEAGKAFGTPYYMSPEQIRGDEQIDGRADVYGLGATLYHMVTGEAPYDAETAEEVMRKHCDEPLTPPDQLRRRLSAGVNVAIARMVAKRPEDRYVSMNALVVELEHILATLP
jgi:serine/threonine protein kinase